MTSRGTNASSASLVQSVFDLCWDAADLLPRRLRRLLGVCVLAAALLNPTWLVAQAQHQAERAIKPAVDRLTAFIEAERAKLPQPPSTPTTSPPVAP